MKFVKVLCLNSPAYKTRGTIIISVKKISNNIFKNDYIYFFFHKLYVYLYLPLIIVSFKIMKLFKHKKNKTYIII